MRWKLHSRCTEAKGQAREEERGDIHLDSAGGSRVERAARVAMTGALALRGGFAQPGVAQGILEGPNRLRVAEGAVRVGEDGDVEAL